MMMSLTKAAMNHANCALRMRCLGSLHSSKSNCPKLAPKSIVSQLQHGPKKPSAAAIRNGPSSSTRSFSSTRLLAEPLPPWKGGFKDSSPDFKYDYPKPDLSSIPMTKNLDNIDKITRMQKIEWPEFSWYSKIGDPASRVYVTFAKDVSRIGYDDEGRIWSFVCPQRAVPLRTGLGCLFIEVTVTGVRGWVDEENKSCYADVMVEGNIWIEPKHGSPMVEALKPLFKMVDPTGEFPFCKERAVKVDAHQVGKPHIPEWPMLNGTDPNIFQPIFKRHYDDGAYSVYHLEVEMGKKIRNKKSPLADRFDDLIYDLTNMQTGGIFAEGQRVSWNVWPLAPEAVDSEEWKGHAKLWKDSMNIKHEYPCGKSLLDREVTFFDGTEYEPEKDYERAIALVKEFFLDAKEIVNHMVGPEKAAEFAKHPIVNFIMNFLGEKRSDYLK